MQFRRAAISPIRIRPRQGELLRDGNRVRHFCIVTNRSDPEGGSGLDLIRWHRQKAGTIVIGRAVTAERRSSGCLTRSLRLPG
jgi:hypothetical protein